MSRDFLLSDRLARYIRETMLREPPIMRELREETERLPQAGMRTGADQVQFLQLLVKLIGAKRCIEVGVFTGYSSLGVALALPPDGTIVACDVNEEYTGVARRYWERAGVAGKIDLYLAPAVTTLEELVRTGGTGHYDFAYIDADKRSYDAYYERCLTLLRPNGLVAIDNVLWSGDVADPSVRDEDTAALRALNAKIGRDERVDASLITIGDGLTIARKR